MIWFDDETRRTETRVVRVWLGTFDMAENAPRAYVHSCREFGSAGSRDGVVVRGSTPLRNVVRQGVYHFGTLIRDVGHDPKNLGSMTPVL